MAAAASATRLPAELQAASRCVDADCSAQRRPLLCAAPRSLQGQLWSSGSWTPEDLEVQVFEDASSYQGGCTHVGRGWKGEAKHSRARDRAGRLLHGCPVPCSASGRPGFLPLLDARTLCCLRPQLAWPASIHTGAGGAQ